MRVTNKKVGMKFDCGKLLHWAEELLGPSKCNTIAFTLGIQKRIHTVGTIGIISYGLI